MGANLDAPIALGTSDLPASRRSGILGQGLNRGDNAAEILKQPDVDGALVGGASLKADSFLAIVAAGR